MAPPSPRRPGFSRRAQYSLFAGYVVSVIGAFMALLFIVTARFDPAGHSALQSLVSDVFSPVSYAARGAVNTVKGGFNETSAYFDAASKNRAMVSEIKAARRKLIERDALALENRRLRQVLNIVQAAPVRPIVAPLISSTGASSRRYATLAAGAMRGVQIGQPVREPDGLVGRVIQRGQMSSRVLLITDGENIVPVKRARDGAPALAVGLGDGRMEIRPIAASNNPFRVGDIFITSGTGGIYPPGIPVAIGVRRGRDTTIARPLADPAALDFALVEPVYVVPAPPAPQLVTP
jgi:rod shape-determining protein MreC